MNVDQKANGVYYTPLYIAEYIVQQTVGNYLQEIHVNRFLQLS